MTSEDFGILLDILKGSGNPLIVLHHGADPDAYCSALGIRHILAGYGHQPPICADKVNSNVKKLIKHTGVAVTDKVDDGHDLVIMMDLGMRSKLGALQDDLGDLAKFKRSVVIDHHMDQDMDAMMCIVDPTSASTCEIVAKLFREGNLPISPNIATMLISGHLYDSGRFNHGVTSNSLKTVAWLIEVGGDYELANQLIQSYPDYSERLARFKSFKRINFWHIGDVLIAQTTFKVYEPSIARALIGAGADVAFVVGQRSTETRATARSTVDFVSLASLMNELAAEFGGSGGGHIEAAGLNIARKLSDDEVEKMHKLFKGLVRSHYSSSKNQ